MSSKDGGPSFKDQFREANPPVNKSGVLPIAEATPVNDSDVADEREPADAARRLLQLEERLQMMERQEQLQRQSQASLDGGSFTKKHWVIIGVLSILVVALSSVAAVLAIGNRSSTVPTFVNREVDLCEEPTDRATAIRCSINSITLTSRTFSFPSQGTPEEEAIEWLINTDVTTSVFDTLSLMQRYVLATLWFGNGPFDSSDVANHAETWMTPLKECEWEVVECVDGEVTSLDLSASGLNGTIPVDLALLTALTTLDLHYNRLSGTIPSQMGLLTTMVDLSLTYSYLSGTIPSQIGLLTQLTALRLFENKLNGTIPSQMGLLTQLTGLVMSGNMLTGTIPSQMGLLTHLTYLGLGPNQLIGTIPNQLVSLTSMIAFSVSSSNITGSMPFCNGDSSRFVDLWADCVSEVDCPCCTACCDVPANETQCF